MLEAMYKQDEGRRGEELHQQTGCVGKVKRSTRKTD